MLDEDEWNDLIEEARDNLGGDFQDYDELIDEAKSILSSKKKSEHQAYLKSPRWQQLRLEILNRDECLCRDCNLILPKIITKFKKTLKYIPEITYRRKANQVHHLNYDCLWTSQEKDYCVSLCGICHQLRHTSYNILRNLLEKKREEIFIFMIQQECLYDKKYIEELDNNHKEYLKFMTIKPIDWLNREIEKNKLKKGDDNGNNS